MDYPLCDGHGKLIVMLVLVAGSGSGFLSLEDSGSPASDSEVSIFDFLLNPLSIHFRTFPSGSTGGLGFGRCLIGDWRGIVWIRILVRCGLGDVGGDFYLDGAV